MMAAPPEGGSLESRINKATNPLNKDTDWGSIHAFCDQLNNELEGEKTSFSVGQLLTTGASHEDEREYYDSYRGQVAIQYPQLAARLLAHKIQSPQEWEAMQALMVLENCMKTCGKRFHSEVGKFRFLNELIKVVSPKYLGTRAPEQVKTKVLELMYSWTVGLPDEAKISDAYQMLKKQGIVKQDPVLPDDKLLLLPPPRPKSTVFEDEEKSKTLTRLLNSTHPEDLRAANKLIKEMVQEDQKRAEKVSKRVNGIREVKESVGLLTQLLDDYDEEAGSQSNEELMKDLYLHCEKLRPTLFRLASDTEDNDEALAEILQANDSLTQVINLYRQKVKGEQVNGENTATPKLTGSSTALLDLTGLDTSFPAQRTYPAFPDLTDSQQEAGISLLDDELMSLGLSDVTPKSTSSSQVGDSGAWDSFQSSESLDTAVQSAPGEVLKPSVTSQSQTPPPSGNTALEELDLLGKTLLQQSLPPENLQVKWDKQAALSKPTLRDLQHKSSASPSLTLAFNAEHPGALNSQPSLGALSLEKPAASAPPSEISLANVTVPLESIKPSSLLPVTVFDRHSLRVLFHFARDSPLSRPDVLVVVISMLSSAPVPVTNIRFQSAVPKVMKVKLQPPSGTELPAFNPILPPAAITQVLLLANPHKEKVRLRYKLTFTLDEEDHNETGDVEQFPPPETWGSL